MSHLCVFFIFGIFLSTLQSQITPKVPHWHYSKGTLQILQKYLCIFLIIGIFLPPLNNYSENTLEIHYQYFWSLSLYSMILQKILVYLPHIGIFLPSPYKVQLLRRYCNDITPKVLLKYSRNTCVSSSYLASFFLHSTTTPKIH